MGIELQLALASFFAGILTILAPCVIPVLPIIVGSSSKDSKDRLKPIIITVSLMVSIVVFTLLLRASTSLISLPAYFWTVISGTILIIFGVFMLFPNWWDWISLKANLSTKSNQLLAKSSKKNGVAGDILIGASLGPVFTSCSPTYAVIVGIVISGEVFAGTIYLLLYALGLGIVMIAVALAGQKLIKRLGWATNPHGWFKRILGITFILIGIGIMTGIDKSLTTWVVDSGLYDWIISLESRFSGR